MNHYEMPSRRLISQEDHAMIARADVPRSTFTGSWTRKTAFDAGKLIPFLADEVLPGDHLRYSVTAYLRMSTPLFPILDSQRVDTHFFFVPNRLLWQNWHRFMGEQDSPSSSIDYLVPLMQSAAGGFAVGSLGDHLGLPTVGQVDPATSLNVNALPFRAYTLIYHEWFRDQNLIAGAKPFVGDGPDADHHYPIYTRAKSHDYFTSALPWPQKFLAPNVPLAGMAPVTGIGSSGSTVNLFNGPVFETNNPNPVNYGAYYNLMVDATAQSPIFVKATAAPTSTPQIFADLTQATGVSINTLRQAWLIQSLLERDARGGTRYTEIVKNHFGVTSPDMRLQRPEYLGGGSSPLTITPIAQTAPAETSDGNTPLGALGGAGTSVGQHAASYAATEHGWIIGLISVKSELSYQQGIPRAFSRKTRYDYYWPSTAGLGEQAILRKEIYATGIPENDDQVFGYQERWHEYRTRYSEVTGIMRSTAAGTLDNWHLAERFNAPPTLGPTFIQDKPPMERVLAAATQATNQQYIADILINRKAVRPIPVFGTPVSIGTF